MADLMVVAIQSLGALMVLFGGALCLWNVAQPEGTAGDRPRASTFSFAESNDYEPAFRQKARHYHLLSLRKWA